MNFIVPATSSSEVFLINKPDRLVLPKIVRTTVSVTGRYGSAIICGLLDWVKLPLAVSQYTLVLLNVLFVKYILSMAVLVYSLTVRVIPDWSNMVLHPLVVNTIVLLLAEKN